jgi:hypothetical protein
MRRSEGVLKGIPQGLKPLPPIWCLRAKPEGLAYLEAKTNTEILAAPEWRAKRAAMALKPAKR